MFRQWLRTVVAFLLALLGAGFRTQDVKTQHAGTAAAANASATASEALGPNVAAPRPPAPHPLEWVLKFAHEEQTYLQRTVRDFICRVTKRERIG